VNLLDLLVILVNGGFLLIIDCVDISIRCFRLSFDNLRGCHLGVVRKLVSFLVCHLDVFLSRIIFLIDRFLDKILLRDIVDDLLGEIVNVEVLDRLRLFLRGLRHKLWRLLFLDLFHDWLVLGLASTLAFGLGRSGRSIFFGGASSWLFLS